MRRAIGRPGRAPEGELWDWQWRWLLGRVLRRVAAAHRATRYAPRRFFVDARFIEFAIARGIVHRVGMADEVAEAFPLEASVTLAPGWPIDAPIPFAVRLGPTPQSKFIFARLDHRVVIEPRVAGSGQACRWDSVRGHTDVLLPPPAHRLPLEREDALGGLLHLPDEYVDGVNSLEFLVRFDVLAYDPQRGGAAYLPLVSTIATASTRRYGSMVDIVPPADDAVLDELVRDGMRFEFRLDEGYARVHLAGECLAELDRIGRVLRLEVIRDGAIVHRQCGWFGVEPVPAPSHPAVTFFVSPDDLGVASPVLSADEEWVAVVRVDPVDLLQRTNAYTYWDGEVRFRLGDSER